jgi:NitT/TauT family transport system permease protein
VFVVWQTAASTRLVSPTFLPGPLDIAKALYSLAVSGQLWLDLSASMIRIGAGWAIGASVGLAVGTGMALFSPVRALGSPIISALYPIPKIAILPLLILWLGIGEFSKIVTISAGVFFPIAIATYTSIDGVPRTLIRMSQSFNVPLHRIIFQTLLPGSLPGIMTGVRISVATSLLVLIAAEMIGAKYGLGAFILLSGNLMRSDHLLAGVVVISILGLTVGFILTRLEKLLFQWR